MADKPLQKVLLVDLLGEKNTAEWLIDSADKLNHSKMSKLLEGAGEEH